MNPNQIADHRGARHLKLRCSVLCAVLIAASSALPAAEIQVFAAASLSDALKEIGGAYEAATGDRPVFNLGASSLLARQVEEGAPADLFLSADEAKMDALAAKSLIVKETRRPLLSNTLAIVVASDSTLAFTSPAEVAEVKRLALGEPQTVPAGIYARAYLTQLGIWEKVSSRVIPCDNVRAALAAVEAGNADAAIVYQTDAAISKKVRVAYAVPAASGPKIVYPGAVVAGARQPEAARKFLEYLAGDAARRVFLRFGFRLAP
ncbi:MAG: molybdate transport system substrate-binding protein [Chthoniobacter sp.]|jgi:molybdate transport system substrate-binding protein|nr:molybdate transport system substrate-binding protein [Chthoniobacter sp.]